MNRVRIEHTLRRFWRPLDWPIILPTQTGLVGVEPAIDSLKGCCRNRLALSPNYFVFIQIPFYFTQSCWTYPSFSRVQDYVFTQVRTEETRLTVLCVTSYTIKTLFSDFILNIIFLILIFIHLMRMGRIELSMQVWKTYRLPLAYIRFLLYNICTYLYFCYNESERTCTFNRQYIRLVH